MSINLIGQVILVPILGYQKNLDFVCLFGFRPPFFPFPSKSNLVFLSSFVLLPNSGRMKVGIAVSLVGIFGFVNPPTFFYISFIFVALSTSTLYSDFVIFLLLFLKWAQGHVLSLEA